MDKVFLFLAWVLTGLIAVSLSALMLYGLWTATGFGTIALVFASVLAAYISLVIASIAGERILRLLKKRPW